MKRQRGRSRNNNNNHKSGNSGNRSFDSNGPDVKVRGSANQVYDKYVAFARDAASSGNRVKAENLRQHAEHYLRVMNAQEAAKQAAREEADARRQAQTSNQASNDESSGDREERRPRRQPRQSKDKPSEKVTDGLEVVTPEAEDVVAAQEETPKPTRRRKAPSKPKPDEAVDAAE